MIGLVETLPQWNCTATSVVAKMKNESFENNLIKRCGGIF